MSVDKTGDMMKRAIIKKSICVEEREELCTDYELTERDEASVVMVSGGVSPMWCALIPVHGESVVDPRGFSLSALREAPSLKEEEDEHARKKKLIIKHMWLKYRGQQNSVHINS